MGLSGATHRLLVLELQSALGMACALSYAPRSFYMTSTRNIGIRMSQVSLKHAVHLKYMDLVSPCKLYVSRAYTSGGFRGDPREPWIPLSAQLCMYVLRETLVLREPLYLMNTKIILTLAYLQVLFGRILVDYLL